MGGALLTGKIDKVIEGEDKNWIVVDLKTGKGFSAWDEEKLSVYDELKLHHYKYQLMMYKILVENSRDYSGHKVTDGVLEFVEEVTAQTHTDGTQNDAEKIQELKLSLIDKDSENEIHRFKKLIVAVYNKIISLDFPDTSKYGETLEGIKEFEDDLIAGVI